MEKNMTEPPKEPAIELVVVETADVDAPQTPLSIRRRSTFSQVSDLEDRHLKFIPLIRSEFLSGIRENVWYSIFFSIVLFFIVSIYISGIVKSWMHFLLLYIFLILVLPFEGTKIDTSLFPSLLKTFEFWYMSFILILYITIVIVNSTMNFMSSLEIVQCILWLFLNFTSIIFDCYLMGRKQGIFYLIMVLIFNIRLFVGYLISDMNLLQICIPKLYCANTQTILISCSLNIIIFQLKYLILFIVYPGRMLLVKGYIYRKVNKESIPFIITLSTEKKDIIRTEFIPIISAEWLCKMRNHIGYIIFVCCLAGSYLILAFVKFSLLDTRDYALVYCFLTTITIILEMTRSDHYLLSLLLRNFEFWYLFGNILIYNAVGIYVSIEIQMYYKIVYLYINIYLSTLFVSFDLHITGRKLRVFLLLCILVKNIQTMVNLAATPEPFNICIGYCISTSTVKTSMLFQISLFIVKYMIMTLQDGSRMQILRIPNYRLLY